MIVFTIEMSNGSKIRNTTEAQDFHTIKKEIADSIASGKPLEIKGCTDYGEAHLLINPAYITLITIGE